MTDSDQLNACYLAGLRMLTRQDCTAGLLFRKLVRRFSEAQVEAAVERLIREGFLQDKRFGERFIASARESGRFTGYRLRQEMYRRGFPAELIDELLQSVPVEQETELEKAGNLVRRRYPGVGSRDLDEREKRRIAGFLQRRGYGLDVIRNLLTSG